MEQEKIDAMTLGELEAAINERKAQLTEEGLSEDVRRQIETDLKNMQDRLEILNQEVWQAMRRGAELPPAPMPY